MNVRLSRLRSRPGFTLLELILAAAISALLMAAISSTIWMIYQVQSASGGRILATELGRNLLLQFERDLLAIPGQLPGATSADSNMTDTSDTLLAVGQDSSDNLSTSTKSMSGYATWLVGEKLSLEFLAEPIGRSGRMFDTRDDPAAQQELLGERRRLIIWELTNDQPQYLPAASASTDTITTIVRKEGLTDTWLSDTQWIEETLLPEAIAMEFSYFDGSTWLDSWDSETEGSLPKAIEMTLTLQARPTRAGQPNPDPETWTTRRIVTLPIQRYR